ncbi:MAG: ParB/RepB/Spo0J family partition protein, partial [Mycobacterium sp.]
MEVHPVADLFPMLADDELKDLAADIAERGLLQPITLDTEGRILDGRNRHAACAIAGIEPSFTTYDGDDPDGYALAVNIARRHLTKGQQAMVAARASCFMKQTEAARALHMSHDRVHRAKTVLDHAPDLADAVIAGSVPLDKAYETARDRKRAAESTDSQLAALRQKAPDLADQVTEERLGLTEAMGALRAREAEEKRRRQVATTLLCDVVVTVGQLDGFDTGQRYDPDMA